MLGRGEKFHPVGYRRSATDRAVVSAFYERLNKHRPFQQALQRLFRRLDALAPVPQWLPVSRQPDERYEATATDDPFAAALAAPPSSQPAPWQTIEAVDRTVPAREAVRAFCQRWRLPAGAEQDLLWSYADRHLVGQKLVVPPTGGRAPVSVAVPVRSLVRSEREATRRHRMDLLRSLGREPIPPRLSRATIDAIADRLFARKVLRRAWPATLPEDGSSRAQRKDRARKVVQRWERRLWSGAPDVQTPANRGPKMTPKNRE
jgi:hypothetical protein